MSVGWFGSGKVRHGNSVCSVYINILYIYIYVYIYIHIYIYIYIHIYIYITSSSFPSSTSSSSLDSARKVRDIVRFGEFPAHPLPNATLEDRNGIAAQQVAGQDVETAEHRLQPSVPTTELYTYIALWLNDFQGDIQALRIPRSMVPRSS
jgi:hypothetical protein